jgi:hypothetical protein
MKDEPASAVLPLSTPTSVGWAQASAAAVKADPEEEAHEHGRYFWPLPRTLELKLRVLLDVIIAFRKMRARETSRGEKGERLESRGERRKDKWTKKEMYRFFRAVNCYGYLPDTEGWESLRVAGQLTKKTTEDIEAYAVRFRAQLEFQQLRHRESEKLEREAESAALRGGDDAASKLDGVAGSGAGDEDGKMLDDAKGDGGGIGGGGDDAKMLDDSKKDKDGQDGDDKDDEPGVKDALSIPPELLVDKSISNSTANKLLLRFDLLRDCRSALTQPDSTINSALRAIASKSSMPHWWEPEVHDLALIKAIAAEGLCNQDKVLSDPEFWKAFRDEMGGVPPERDRYVRLHMRDRLPLVRRLRVVCDAVHKVSTGATPDPVRKRGRKRRACEDPQQLAAAAALALGVSTPTAASIAATPTAAAVTPGSAGAPTEGGGVMVTSVQGAAAAAAAAAMAAAAAVAAAPAAAPKRKNMKKKVPKNPFVRTVIDIDRVIVKIKKDRSAVFEPEPVPTPRPRKQQRPGAKAAHDAQQIAITIATNAAAEAALAAVEEARQKGYSMHNSVTSIAIGNHFNQMAKDAALGKIHPSLKAHAHAPHMHHIPIPMPMMQLKSINSPLPMMRNQTSALPSQLHHAFQMGHPLPNRQQQQQHQHQQLQHQQQQQHHQQYQQQHQQHQQHQQMHFQMAQQQQHHPLSLPSLLSPGHANFMPGGLRVATSPMATTINVHTSPHQGGHL